MSLNLGITNVTAEDDMSFEELYIKAMQVELKLTQHAQQLKDLENARTIQTTAKKYASQECIAFAEELLGFSVEVDLSKAGVAGKYGDTHAIFEGLAKKLNLYADQVYALYSSCSEEELEKIGRALEAKYKSQVEKLMSSAKDYMSKYSEFIGTKEFGNIKQSRMFDGIDFASPNDIKQYLKAWVRYSKILASTGKADAALNKNARLGSALRDGIAVIRRTLALGFSVVRDIKRMKKQ